MRIRALILILVLLGMIGLVGCGQGAIFRGSSGNSSPNPTPTPTPLPLPPPPPPPPPTATLVSIGITPVGPAVTIGGSYQLRATGTFSDQSTQDLTSSATWSVDQSTILTVSAGRVTGKAVGVAVITATSGKISGSTPVNVTRLSAGPGTLTGSYAFFLTTIDSRGQAVVAGSFTVDGAGHITSGVADYNMARGVSSTGPVNITASAYTLWPDGRGEADIKFNSQIFHVAFVLTDFVSGFATRGKMISFDGSNAFGNFELQTPGTNLNTHTNNNYVFEFNGLDSNNLAEAEIGLFNTGASLGSSSTGIYDVDDNGTIDGAKSTGGAVTPLTLSPVTINPVSTGNRGTATLGKATYAFYTVSASKAYFIETDSGAHTTALAGMAELQTATVPLAPENSPSDCGDSATALEPYCNYAFLLTHAASAQNGTFEKAGQLDFCPCDNGGIIGGITGHLEDDYADGEEWTIGSGSRDFDATGRGLFAYPVSNSATQGYRFGIAYVVSTNPGTNTALGSSRLYVMNADFADASPGIGVADFIDAVPTEVPAAGPYTFSATSIGNTNLMELGQVVFSGSNVTGIAYVNNNGTLSTEAVSGTFAPSTKTAVSGDGKGTISPFNGTTTSVGVYSVGSRGLILLGASTNNGGIDVLLKPFINGRMEPQ
jgi:hypothetical protein